MSIKRFTSKGYTLVELLVVIAILGVLATIVLVAINPAEHLRKADDGKTKQSVAQVGGAITSFFSQRQIFPVVDTDWMSDLINNGDLGDRPPQATATCSPSSARDTNYCLQVSGQSAVVYAQLSSQIEDSKCETSSDVPYFVYDTSRGRGCIVCGGTTETFSPGVTCDAAD